MITFIKVASNKGIEIKVISTNKRRFIVKQTLCVIQILIQPVKTVLLKNLQTVTSL